MVTITLLGTASLLPLPDRAETAAFLSCNGRGILLDCGEGTQTAARKADVNLMRTDLIALTHYLGDHVFGLPGLLQSMSVLGRTEPITITGPAGLNQELQPLLRLTGKTTYEIRVMRMPEGGLPLKQLHSNWPDGATLTAFGTNHRVSSQGYCFTLDRAGKFQPDKAKALGIPVQLWSRLQRGETVAVDGKTYRPEEVLGPARKGIRFVFSGDTSPCSSLIQASMGADLLICEGTYGDPEQTETALERGHMTFSQAAEIAAAAGVKELWLAHYSQMMQDPVAYLPYAASIFPGAVCGVDGMSKTLTFPD